MADVNANIGVNIDTSAALAQLKALQRQISQFHTSIAKSSETATLAQRDLQKNFLNSVNAIGAFSAELRTVKTTAESFTDSLQKNKFSMREYFRFAGGATKTFGKLFKSEFDTIGKVADDRVKRLQTQYIKLGRDTSGVMKAIAIMPNQLDMSNFSTQTQLAAQKQAIFNQLVKQGSTNLLNFGKNTQWAGRQLMVGFTLPLATLGTVATRTFMEMEAQTIKFRKVYGDLFTPTEETTQALDNITALGQMFTQYGIAVSQTVGLAAEAAAAGFSGVDLQRQTTEATRLSILGQVDAQKALETTISLQNAFKMSSDQLASSIDFLNAVENQTVVSLDDITTAIPKVAPVIQQLGGDVKDLAFFIAALKEGGVNASEGANALKSGLAALINPTEKASAMLAGYGININKIIEGNQGDLKTTVVEFAKALDTLDPLTRARAIEQLFGKFQFARLSTLFSNVINETGQASRVLDLAGSSIEDLAALSESELGMTADSAMNKFRKSVEDLKFALVPVGQTFLQAVTPIVEFIGGILEKFNNLSTGVKKAIVVLTVAIGAIGPIALMTFGLLANGLANIVKGALVLRNGYLRLTGQTQILGEQTEYLTMEQIDAAAASHSLDQSHARLTQTFTAESSAVTQLIAAYQQATAAAAKFAAINPGMMRVPGAPTKRAKGKPVVVGGSGNQDTELALLTPGETVIPAEMSKRYGALINGMIAGNIPGYQQGRGIKGFKNATIYLQEQINTAMGGSGRGASMSDVLGSLKQSGGAAAAPLLAVIANDIKKGLNNPNNYKEYSTIGDTLINAAINALETSGKEFVKDIDLEEIVVPAMKDAAAGLSVAGVEIKDALERAIEQIRTVAPIGVASGAAGGQGRTNLPGSYRATGKTAQEFAMKKNADVFARQTVQSQSRGTKQVFKMRDVDSQKYVTATMAHIMPSINASVSEIENKISAYVPQAAKRLEKIGEQAGKKIGKSTVDGVAIGAKTASPSKDTIKTGQDIGRGLEIGMDSMQDDVAVSGQELGSAAVGGTQSGARQRRSASRPQGAPGSIGLSGAVNSAVSPAIKSAIDTEVKARKTSAARIDSMNRGLMAGTFALTSLAGAGSMAGGTIGNLSQQVMKFSGLLFALMSVTQLLTQAKFAQLIATRATTVATAMGGTGFKSLFSRGGGLAGFGKNILTAGKFLLRFAGPIGLATTAMIGTISVIKMVNAARERERLAIEGLGDAALLTKDKVKTLGDFFNVVPATSPFQTQTQQVRGTPEERSRVDLLKASEEFQKQFKKDIASIKSATDDQAKLIFDSLSIQLRGKGFAKEQIETIIKALQEEAGKTNIKFDFSSLDLTTDAGILNFQKTLNSLSKTLGEDFVKGYTSQIKYGLNGATGEVVTWTQTNLSKSLKQNLNLTAKSFTGFIDGISGQLASGVINADQFNAAFARISSQIAGMPKPQAMLLLNKIMESLPEDLSKAATGLKNVSDKMLILQAKAVGLTFNLLGIVEAMNLIANPTADISDKIFAKIKVDKFKKDVEAATRAWEKLFPPDKPGTIGGSGTDGNEDTEFELAIKQLQKQQLELKNTRIAYDLLKEAGFDAATATKYASDSVIALGLATGKISTKQIEEVKTLMEDIEKRAGSEAILNFLDSLRTENTLKESFAGIVPTLLAMGATTKDIENILGNSTLMQSFVDPLATAEQKAKRIQQYLDAVRTGEAIDIRFDLIINPDKAKEELRRKADELFGFLERAAQREYKPLILAAELKITNKEKTGAKDEVDRIQAEIDAIQSTIDKEQRDLEKNITRKIEGYQEDVNDLQRIIEMEFDRDIEDMQKEVGLLERDIELDFDRPIDDLQKSIAEIEREIDLNFDRPIEALQNAINDIERGIELNLNRPLEDLQKTSADLSNDLTLIDKASESINEKYDAQAEALQKVSTINQQILNQQKQQISIADALTQGDISAAAQAIQESRATSADVASANAENTLQIARQLELDKLRNAAGLTRKQIEEKQFEISQKIFNIEKEKEKLQSIVQAKQDQIFAIEKQREQLQSRIKIKQDEIFVIEKQREAVQARIQIIQDRIFVIEKQRELVLEDIRRIEDDIYDLEEKREAVMLTIRGYEDDIYNLKVDQLKPAQKALEDAEKELQIVRDQLQARLDDIELQKDAWQAAADAEIAAAIAAGDYNDVLDATVDILNNIVGIWGQIASAAAAATAAMAAASSGSLVVPGANVSGANSSNSYIAPQDTAESIAALEEFLRIVAELDAAILALEDAEARGLTPAQTTALRGRVSAAQKAYDDYVNAGLPAQTDTATLAAAIAAAEAANASAEAAILAAEAAQADVEAAIEAADAAATEYDAAVTAGLPSGVIDNLAKTAAAAAKAVQDASSAVISAADAAAEAADAAESAAKAATAAESAATSSSTGSSGGGFDFMLASSGGMVPRYLSSGGMIKPKYFAVGGSARGTDTIPAMLTPGEFVMSKYAVNSYGVDKMKAINSGTYEGEKVYNYNLSVNVKSDANPDDIARVVMTQIRQIDSQRIRTQRA